MPGSLQWVACGESAEWALLRTETRERERERERDSAALSGDFYVERERPHTPRVCGPMKRRVETALPTQPASFAGFSCPKSGEHFSGLSKRKPHHQKERERERGVVPVLAQLAGR